MLYKESIKVVEAKEKRPLDKVRVSAKNASKERGNVQRRRVRDAGAGCSPGIVDVGESLLVGVHGGADEGLLGVEGTAKEERRNTRERWGVK